LIPFVLPHSLSKISCTLLRTTSRLLWEKISHFTNHVTNYIVSITCKEDASRVKLQKAACPYVQAHAPKRAFCRQRYPLVRSQYSTIIIQDKELMRTSRSLDPDLPEEARALLLTPESLLDLAISKGKTLNDSRWAPHNFDRRRDHSKPLPPKQLRPKVEPITATSICPKQFKFSPAAQTFTPPKSIPLKQRELSPKAEPFRPITPLTPPSQLELSPVIPFSIPNSYKMSGLAGSRYADKRHDTGKFT
jgi:hypothetical protein